MTCRRDRLKNAVLAALAMLLAGGCAERAPASDPVELARNALAAGNALGAEIALEAMIARGAAREDVAALMGEAALLAGKRAAAREWLGPGQFSPETRVHGLRMLGRLEMADGHFAAAGKAFDAALATAPGDPELWVDIGRLRYRGGEQIGAIAAAEKALALDPANAAALLFRGQLARDAEGLSAAASWFARALELQPGNIELRADYAATLGDAGRAREALAVLRDEGNGDGATPHPRTLYIQAVLAARGGNTALARSLLQRSGQVEANIPAATMLAALLDCADGNFASAAQTLDRLAAMQPDNARVREVLAYALSRSDGERELIDRFGARALDRGGSSYLRALVGRAYETLGDRETAARYLDLAVRPELALTVLPVSSSDSGPGGAIRAALGAGDYVAAHDRAAAFASIHPGSGDALALLGDTHLAAGRKVAARSVYLRSASIRRNWPLMLRMLAAQDHRAEAARLLEAYVRQHTAGGAAAALLADAYAAAGEWERAALLLDHAIANGQGRVPFVLAARSAAAANLSDADGALDFALRAHELQPMNIAATAALIAALPSEETEARAELEQKLRSLTAR